MLKRTVSFRYSPNEGLKQVQFYRVHRHDNTQITCIQNGCFSFIHNGTNTPHLFDSMWIPAIHCYSIKDDLR